MVVNYDSITKPIQSKAFPLDLESMIRQIEKSKSLSLNRFMNWAIFCGKGFKTLKQVEPCA